MRMLNWHTFIVRIVLNAIFVFVVMTGIRHLSEVGNAVPSRIEMHMLAAEAQRHGEGTGHRGQHEV